MSIWLHISLVLYILWWRQSGRGWVSANMWHRPNEQTAGDISWFCAGIRLRCLNYCPGTLNSIPVVWTRWYLVNAPVSFSLVLYWLVWHHRLDWLHRMFRLLHFQILLLPVNNDATRWGPTDQTYSSHHLTNGHVTSSGGYKFFKAKDG